MRSTPNKLLSMPWLFLLSVSNSFGFLIRMGELEPSVPQPNVQKPIEKHIQQKLDHFSELVTTWNQRYFQELKYHKPGGPVFIYISGEKEIVTRNLESGQMIRLAKKFHAAVFGLEHRYYGMSIPQVAIEERSLEYLSSKQALADLAEFIQYIKKVYPEIQKPKVIVFGCSYAGNLAVWMRLIYPDLVDGAVASSAPVQAQMVFPEYYETVGESLKKYDPQCEAAIRNATAELKDRMEKPDAVKFIQEHFKLNMNTLSPTGVFKYLAKPFAGIVQQQYKRIPALCNNMMNGSLPLLDRYSKVRLQHNADAIKKLIQPTLNYTSFIKNNAWNYQTCNEFGYFQTFSEKQPFGKVSQVEERIGNCHKYHIDHSTLQSNVKQTNDYYGGRHPNVTRVVFVNGDLDPWHKLGITTDLNPESPAILIEGTSHCTDIADDDPTDEESLKDARKRIEQEVSEWVGGYTM